MPNTLEKTRKQISKKRNGDVGALHVKSRNSMRLHKAAIRDQRLEKLASARNKREQPIVDRVAYFQAGLREKDGKALELATVRDLITTFISQYQEEHDALRKSRHANRPSSAREDLLKMKIAALELEFEQGFLLPDVMTQDNAKIVDGWHGTWTYLTTIPWIKVPSDGPFRPADFPSKGLN